MKYKDARDKTYETSNVKCMKNILLKARNEGLKREIGSSTWQGVMFKTRWNDEHPETNCFPYLTSWKTCPVQLISEVQGLYCHLLPKKLYQLIHSVSNDQNTICRMCKRSQESVKRVLSNCESLAKYDFILRHESVFKCIVFPILTQYKPMSYMVFTIKGEKIDKYRNVLNKLKLDYPNYEVNQLTFIIDVLGGHSKHLRENISKIVKDKARIKCIIYNMQRSVLSSAVHITRKFKFIRSNKNI